MITIIAGKYRGRKLMGVSDPGVRPTLARVKKSVMQILEPFGGAEVLDLYAGIGTLGIEALSRGARSVTAVEKNYSIFRILRQNFEKICHEDEYHLVKMDVHHHLTLEDREYDLILADPPYHTEKFEELKTAVLPYLKSGGIFCMEMKKTPLEARDVRIKLYGKTQVVFWRNPG